MGKGKIKVKLFGRLRELSGNSQIIFDEVQTITAGEILLNLQQRFPAIKTLSPRLLMAVNGNVAAEDSVVTAGDDVAILTPFSGG